MIILLLLALTARCMAAGLSELEALVANGKFSQARTLAAQLHSQYGRQASYHTALAQLAKAQGDQEAAIAELAVAINLDKHDPKAAVALADIYLHNLELEKSLTAAHQAVATDGHYLPGRLKLVEVLLKCDQTGEADRQLKYILETFPISVEIKLLVFELAKKKQDWSRAREALEYLIADAPNNATLRLMLAEVLIDSGDKEGARNCLAGLVATKPGLEAAKLQLAHILEMQFHEFIPAAELYKKVLAGNQENTDAQRGLERTQRKQRDIAYRLKLILQRMSERRAAPVVY